MECKYCGKSIEEESEQSELDHLVDAHFDELSRIDSKRVERQWEGDLDDVRSSQYRYSALTIGVSVTVAVFFIGLLVAILI